jgi:hypothetical protein
VTSIASRVLLIYLRHVWLPAALFAALGSTMVLAPQPWVRLASLYRSGSVLSLGAEVKRPLRSHRWRRVVRAVGAALLLLALSLALLSA